MNTTTTAFVYLAATLASLVLATLAVQSSQFEPWVRYCSAAVLAIVAIACIWILLRRTWSNLRTRLFPPRLTRGQRTKLETQLDDVDDLLSSAHTLSIVYVWHRCANDNSSKIQFGHRYCTSMHRWLSELRTLHQIEVLDDKQLMRTAHAAVVESAHLGEEIEQSLRMLINDPEFAEDQRTKLRNEWDRAQTHFNQWLYRWIEIFKDFEKRSGNEARIYIRLLEKI